MTPVDAFSQDQNLLPEAPCPFAYDPDKPGRRLMTHTKGSVSSKTRSLEYFIDDDGGFRWGSQSDETADDVLGVGESKAKRESRELIRRNSFLRRSWLRAQCHPRK